MADRATDRRLCETEPEYSSWWLIELPVRKFIVALIKLNKFTQLESSCFPRFFMFSRQFLAHNSLNVESKSSDFGELFSSIEKEFSSCAKKQPQLRVWRERRRRRKVYETDLNKPMSRAHKFYGNFLLCDFKFSMEKSRNTNHTSGAALESIFGLKFECPE